MIPLYTEQSDLSLIFGGEVWGHNKCNYRYFDPLDQFSPPLKLVAWP